MTEPSLAARAYARALRMYQNNASIAKPKREDFDHLDDDPSLLHTPAGELTAAPAKSPEQPLPVGDHDAAVRAALDRMQRSLGRS